MESYRKDQVDVFVESGAMDRNKLALIDKHFKNTGCARAIFSEQTDMVRVKFGDPHSTDNRYVTVAVYYNSNTLDAQSGTRAMCRHLVFRIGPKDDAIVATEDVTRIGGYHLVYDEYQSVTHQKASEVLTGVVHRSYASTRVLQDTRLGVLNDNPFHIIRLDANCLTDAIDLAEIKGSVQAHARAYAKHYCRQLALKNARYSVEAMRKTKVSVKDETATLEMAMFGYLFYMDYHAQGKSCRDIFIRGYTGAHLGRSMVGNYNGHKIVAYIEKTVREHLYVAGHNCNIIYF